MEMYITTSWYVFNQSYCYIIVSSWCIIVSSIFSNFEMYAYWREMTWTNANCAFLTPRDISTLGNRTWTLFYLTIKITGVREVSLELGINNFPQFCSLWSGEYVRLSASYSLAIKLSSSDPDLRAKFWIPRFSRRSSHWCLNRSRRIYFKKYRH